MERQPIPKWLIKFFIMKIEAARACGDTAFAQNLAVLFFELEQYSERGGA